eukprot:s630_g7.t1
MVTWRAPIAVGRDAADFRWTATVPDGSFDSSEGTDRESRASSMRTRWVQAVLGAHASSEKRSSSWETRTATTASVQPSSAMSSIGRACLPVSNGRLAAKRLAKRSGLYLAKRCSGDRRQVHRPDGGISHYIDREDKVCTRYWVVQRDSSLDNIKDMESMELSSRAKALQDLEGDIDAVSDALCDLDARITKSCGLHVHMDMTQLSKAKMKHVTLVNFARLWVRLEPLLLAAVPPSRRDNEYCEQVAPHLRTKSANRLWFGHEYFAARHVKKLLNPRGKYHTVNFPDEDRVYHTIEVRLHSGTVEAWKIKRWVKLCLQLLEVCKGSWDDDMRKLVRRACELRLLNQFVDEEVRAHIIRRAFHFIQMYPDSELPYTVSWLKRAAQHGYAQGGKWQEYDCPGCGERFPSDVPLSEATALCWSCLHKPDGGVKLPSPEAIEKPVKGYGTSGRAVSFEPKGRRREVPVLRRVPDCEQATQSAAPELMTAAALATADWAGKRPDVEQRRAQTAAARLEKLEEMRQAKQRYRDQAKALVAATWRPEPRSVETADVIERRCPSRSSRGTGTAMPQQAEPEAKDLDELTEVPAVWPLATVIDAFAELAYADANRAREVVSRRLVELWASQPEEAEAWLERFAKEINGMATRRERLCEALLRHGAAEFGKYGDFFRFSEAGLLRGELCPAAEPERWYLQQSYIRDGCRELAERLVAAESPETARKRQKLEEETSERKRLEAELQKSQQECRELSNRLAAAEAEVSGKDAELQAAQSDRAKCKERCEELAARAAAAETATAEIREELGQLQRDHRKCQQHFEELVARLEAAEAVVFKHAENEDRVTAVQLTKAVLQGRCEQLQKQLDKAEDQMKLAWGEKATFKERCRQLEQQLLEAKQTNSVLLSGGLCASDTASSSQESNLSEPLGYVLGGDCFMPDDIFTTRTDGVDHLVCGRLLKKGSRVLAADGETIFEVCANPVLYRAKKIIPGDYATEDQEDGGSGCFVPAISLKPGALVMLDSGEPAALTNVIISESETADDDYEVLKLTFKPNLSVAVFSHPPCILSKGAAMKPSIRRGKMWKRLRGGQGKGEETLDDGRASMPNTAGTSTEMLLRAADRRRINCLVFPDTQAQEQTAATLLVQGTAGERRRLGGGIGTGRLTLQVKPQRNVSSFAEMFQKSVGQHPYFSFPFSSGEWKY